MRKLITIAVLACLFFELGGYYFVFLVNRLLIKNEVQVFLRDHPDAPDQETFHFAALNGNPLDPDFEWEEEHEFRYRGEMYDVIDSRQSHDSLHVRCIPDSRETRLITEIAKLGGHRKQGRSSGASSVLLQLLNTPFLPESLAGFFPVFSKTDYIIPDNRVYPGPAGDVLTPPPQPCSFS